MLASVWLSEACDAPGATLLLLALHKHAAAGLKQAMQFGLRHAMGLPHVNVQGAPLQAALPSSEPAMRVVCRDGHS